jgi:hypothetical protein
LSCSLKGSSCELEATNRLSTRLKSKYGEDSVALVTKNKDGSFVIQGDTSKVKDKKIHEARAFNFTYRYIDDVLSINNSRFAEFLP